MSKATSESPYVDLTSARIQDGEAAEEINAATANKKEAIYETGQLPFVAAQTPEALYEIPVIGGGNTQSQQQEEIAPNPPPRPSLAAKSALPDEYQAAAQSAQKLSTEFLESKQPNTAEKYGDIRDIVHKLIGGQITKEEAEKSLGEVGSDVTDKGLNVFLNLVKLICRKEDYELESAGKSAIENFSYLAGENKEPLENLMKAADKLTNDEKIPANLRQEMSGSLAEDVFGKKQEQKEAERTKPESKTASPSENSSSFGKKELINIFKGAVTIGLTAGFPPAGWALSLGFLYLTKNWGKDSEKDKEKLEEFESKMQQVKDMGTKTKAATAAVAQETTTENMQASENLAAANQTENQQSAANLAPVNQEELQAGAVGSEQETSPENQQAAATNLDSAAQPNSQAAGATQETAKTTTNLDGALGESGETTNESASNNRATAMSEAGAAVKKATSEQENSSAVENINTATTGKAQGGGGINV